MAPDAPTPTRASSTGTATVGGKESEGGAYCSSALRRAMRRQSLLCGRTAPVGEHLPVAPAGSRASSRPRPREGLELRAASGAPQASGAREPRGVGGRDLHRLRLVSLLAAARLVAVPANCAGSLRVDRAVQRIDPRDAERLDPRRRKAATRALARRAPAGGAYGPTAASRGAAAAASALEDWRPGSTAQRADRRCRATRLDRGCCRPRGMRSPIGSFSRRRRGLPWREMTTSKAPISALRQRRRRTTTTTPRRSGACRATAAAICSRVCAASACSSSARSAWRTRGGERGKSPCGRRRRRRCCVGRGRRETPSSGAARCSTPRLAVLPGARGARAAGFARAAPPPHRARLPAQLEAAQPRARRERASPSSSPRATPIKPTPASPTRTAAPRPRARCTRKRAEPRCRRGSSFVSSEELKRIRGGRRGGRRRRRGCQSPHAPRAAIATCTARHPDARAQKRARRSARRRSTSPPRTASRALCAGLVEMMRPSSASWATRFAAGRDDEGRIDIARRSRNAGERARVGRVLAGASAAEGGGAASSPSRAARADDAITAGGGARARQAAAAAARAPPRRPPKSRMCARSRRPWARPPGDGQPPPWRERARGAHLAQTGMRRLRPWVQHPMISARVCARVLRARDDQASGRPRGACRLLCTDEGICGGGRCRLASPESVEPRTACSLGGRAPY